MMILLVENDYAQLKWQLREQRQEDSCNLSKHSKFHSPEYSQRFWEFVLRRKQAQKLIIEGCGKQICVHVADLVICRVVVDNALLVEQTLNAMLKGDEVLLSVLYITNSEAL